MAESIELDGRVYVKPFEKHTAESRWQFCNCLTCQNKRILLDSLPGPKIDFTKFRLKDEDY